MTVTEEVHTEIVNGHYALLQQAEEVHRRCTQALLGGGGIPQVLGHPGRLRRQPGVPGDPRRTAAVRGRRGPSGRGAAPGVGGAARAAQGAPPPPVGPGGRGGRRAGHRCRARPAGEAARVARRSLQVHRIAAERAAGILAVVLMQARQEEELAARGPGRLPDRPRRGPDRRGGRPGAGAGPRLPAGRRPAAAGGDAAGDGISPGRGLGGAGAGGRGGTDSVGVPVLLGVRPVEGRVPLLLGLRSESERPRWRTGSRRRCGPGWSGRDGTAGAAPAGGRRGDGGRLGGGLGGAAARRGDGDGRAGPARPPLVRRPAAGHRPAAVAAARPPRPGGVRGPRDRPAARSRPRSRPALLPTLETYLAHAGRKAETARELHLNRQTLYNRLARIGELLGTDLDDPQTVLALSLALRARRHVPRPRNATVARRGGPRSGPPGPSTVLGRSAASSVRQPSLRGSDHRAGCVNSS